MFAYARNNPLKFVDPNGTDVTITAKNEEEARKRFAIVASKGNRNRSELCELGRLYLNEDLLEAEYYLRRAAELAPFDGWAHIYLGNLLWRIEKLDSAEAAFRRAIEVWPDQSAPYWCLAYFLERQGQQQEAQNLYLRALEMDPGDMEANRRFGCYLKDVGHFEEAKEDLLRALYLNPADEKAAAMLAIVENELNPES